MKIIFDKDLVHIKVVDNKEPLVDIKDFSRIIKVDLRPKSREFFGKNICLVRKSVAIKLARMNENLKGMRLVICDGYRPIELQRKLYEDFRNKMKKEHPEWNSIRLETECSKFVAPVTKGVIPPHSTGGTVDITLEKNGRLLDMGTKLGNLSIRSATLSNDVPAGARRNRMLLSSIMAKAGFVNYPLEWWHWSYGDRTWAYYEKEKVSFYGTVPYARIAWK